MQISRIRLDRTVSLQGLRRGALSRRSQELQAKALQLGLERLTLPGAEGTLAPTLQMMNQPCDDEPVQFAEGRTGVAVTVVLAPALQPAIDRRDHLGDGHEASLRSGPGSSPALEPAPCPMASH